MWFKSDLVVVDDITALESKVEPIAPVAEEKTVNNMQYLHQKGINVLYHFTDVANLDSIRKHGLMSVACIDEISPR